MGIRFGDYLLDAGTRQLLRKSRAVSISPKAFRLLEILVERRPNAVSKDELQDLLWPAVFVAEGNLARLMTEVRDAIGDDSVRPRWVRTVHGFGYAFSGEANAEARPLAANRASTFRLIWADREIALAEGENVVGRDEGCLVWIDVHSVSRRHARIVVRGAKATLEDLHSKNGTFLGGQRVGAPVPLEDRDEIRIGTVPLTVRRFALGASTRTTRPR